MTLKYNMTISFENWNLYLKAHMTLLIKWLRADFPALAHMLTPQLILQLVHELYERMTRLLSFRAPVEDHFAPILSKYLFLNTEKDGSLHEILQSIIGFFAERELAPSIRELDSESFQQMYLQIYQLLETSNFIDRHSFCFLEIPDQQRAQLEKFVKHLRGDIVNLPEDATVIIKPQTSFLPPLCEDFNSLRKGQQIQSCDLLRTNKYFLRLAERIIDKKEALVHARCTPPDFDFVMYIKDFVAVRERQVNNSARELDDFPDAVYWQEIQFQAVILSPRFLEDSYFFNEYMIIYDYLTSVQESEIDRIQAKFTRKRSEDLNLTKDIGEIEQLVYQWNCKERQAENKPANRHEVSRSVFRGFETYNQEGGLLNTNELKGGNKEQIQKIEEYTEQQFHGNNNIQEMIQEQNFIDQHGELHSHIAVTGSQGVLLAGYPFTLGQRGAFSDVIRKKHKDENIITFYVRYFSRLDFQIVCNINDAMAVLRNEPIPFDVFEEKPDYQYARRLVYQLEPSQYDVFYDIQDHISGESVSDANPVLQSLLCDVFQAPVVEAERRRLIEQDPRWFCPESLSQYELDALPGIDHDKLLASRNLLICAWRALPHVHLRFSNTSSFIKLPFAQAELLYDFLEREKLINDERVLMATTIPSYSYLHNSTLLRMTFKCGKCAAQNEQFCYFFCETLQPNEHEPQVLCIQCHDKQTPEIEAKYIVLKPKEIDRHKAFIITDAFRKSAAFGWETALKMAAEAGGVSECEVLNFLVAFKEGERNAVGEEDVAVEVWEEEARNGFKTRGICCSGVEREAVIANAIISGKREFCRALQEFEIYYNNLNSVEQ